MRGKPGWCYNAAMPLFMERMEGTMTVERKELRIPGPSLWGLLIIGFAVGLGLGLGGAATAGAQEGQLAVDCEANTAQVEGECAFGEQQEFTVSIQALTVPAAGYVAVQAKLRWDNAIVDYRPTDEPAQEAVWPDCGIPARLDNRPEDASVLFGCVSFPVAPSSYTGPLLQFAFACVSVGTSQLTLVPRAGDVQNGSHFIELDPEGEQTLIDPILTGASVTCGEAADQPTPAPTDQPSGTQPPGTQPPGTQPPGTPPPGTATGSPTPTLPDTGQPGDTRSDAGTGVSAVVWVLVSLAVIAGGGGLGFLTWRRLSSR